jgi:hypothetical protein
MNRRGLSLLELILTIGITSVVGAAVASMMAAATNSLTTKDDGRQTAILLATTQVRLGAYIAPARCILDKSNTYLTIWTDDSRESNTVHSSEIRWIRFDPTSNLLSVFFVDFPEEWSQSMIDAADVECNESTDYESLLLGFQSDDLVDSIPLVDAMASCTFWTNDSNPLDATRVCVRFSFSSSSGETSDSLVDETIRVHISPSEY